MKKNSRARFVHACHIAVSTAVVVARVVAVSTAVVVVAVTGASIDNIAKTDKIAKKA